MSKKRRGGRTRAQGRLPSAVKSSMWTRYVHVDINSTRVQCDDICIGSESDRTYQTRTCRRRQTRWNRWCTAWQCTRTRRYCRRCTKGCRQYTNHRCRRCTVDKWWRSGCLETSLPTLESHEPWRKNALSPAHRASKVCLLYNIVVWRFDKISVKFHLTCTVMKKTTGKV